MYLQLYECSIDSESRHDRICTGRDKRFTFSQGLTNWNQLSELHLQVADGHPNSTFSIDILYSLRSLKLMDLTVGGIAHFSSGLTQLTMLTNLQVSVFDDGRPDLRHASYNVSWDALQTLQSISIAGPAVFFDSIQTITQLQQLTYLSMSGCQPMGDSSAWFMSLLAQCITEKCPQVTLRPWGSKTNTSSKTEDSAKCCRLSCISFWLLICLSNLCMIDVGVHAVSPATF